MISKLPTFAKIERVQAVVSTGGKNGPWTGVWHHDGVFCVAEGGQLEGGRILRITADGTSTEPNQVIVGRIPCSGAVLCVGPKGGRPELVAWGFRNPFGLAFAPDEQLYVADNRYYAGHAKIVNCCDKDPGLGAMLTPRKHVLRVPKQAMATRRSHGTQSLV